MTVAPGILRVGINLANPLLVSGRSDDGDPIGVAPSLGAALAARYRMRYAYVIYASAGRLAAATDWDVAFLAADAARAATITFSPAYAEIDVRYLVHPDSTLSSAVEVDREGVAVVAEAGSAYELWLGANLRSAELVRADGSEDAQRRFSADPSAVLAGLTPALRGIQQDAGGRILHDRVTSVRQAIGVPVGRQAESAETAAFVGEAIESGLVRELVERFGVADDLVIPQ